MWFEDDIENEDELKMMTFEEEKKSYYVTHANFANINNQCQLCNIISCPACWPGVIGAETSEVPESPDNNNSG